MDNVIVGEAEFSNPAARLRMLELLITHEKFHHHRKEVLGQIMRRAEALRSSLPPHSGNLPGYFAQVVGILEKSVRCDEERMKSGSLTEQRPTVHSVLKGLFRRR